MHNTLIMYIQKIKIWQVIISTIKWVDLNALWKMTWYVIRYMPWIPTSTNSNTHNTVLQVVRIDSNKHSFQSVHTASRYSITSPHNISTYVTNCIQQITENSMLTGDVSARSTLWYSYTDDHRRTLISNIINNTNHITLSTNIPTGIPNTSVTTHRHTPSPDITFVSWTLYNIKTWGTKHLRGSDHLPIFTTLKK